MGLLFALLGGASVVQFILISSGVWGSEEFNAWGAISWAILAVIDLVLLFIALRFTEGLLITEAQVLRACKAYTVIKTYPETAQPDHWGMDRIKDYLDRIPESFWEEGCG